jgi:toxin ParE1/3/4
MSLPIRFLVEARDEYDDAADWYEQQKPGLGAVFTARVDEAITRVAANPQMHAIVFGEMRKALVRGFPYVVYYVERPGELVIMSVFHTSRDPAIWQSRVIP